MSRKKGARAYNSRFKTFEGKDQNGRHVRLTEDMLKSPAWIDLKATSTKLYIHIKLRYTGANADTIQFPYSEAEKIISKNIISTCFKDLISHGFLEIVREGRLSRLPNVYKLSSQWQNWTK